MYRPALAGRTAAAWRLGAGAGTAIGCADPGRGDYSPGFGAYEENGAQQEPSQGFTGQDRVPLTPVARAARHRHSPISDPRNRQRQPDIAGPAARVSVEERLSA
jgi:hypothetical protein